LGSAIKRTGKENKEHSNPQKDRQNQRSQQNQQRERGEVSLLPYLPKKTDRGSKEQERQLEIAGERRDRSAVDAHSSPERVSTLGEGRGQNRASLK
jgi:hypothetical protein